MSAITSFTGVNSFLSNFANCKIAFEGVSYVSVEHAYQAAKTLDPLEREQIRQAASPAAATRAGRKVKIRADWERVKLGIMRGLVNQKFSEPRLARMLLATGDAMLIEGNAWGDVYWGAMFDNGGWTGENHLGKILTDVRDDLRRSSW